MNKIPAEQGGQLTDPKRFRAARLTIEFARRGRNFRVAKTCKTISAQD
jgi:hypothetical protein